VLLKFLQVKSDEVEDEGEDNECQTDPLGHLGKFAVPGLCLCLCHKGVRAAGDCTGKTAALTRLEKNNAGEEQSGEKLDNCKSKTHLLFNPFDLIQIKYQLTFYHDDPFISRYFFQKNQKNPPQGKLRRIFVKNKKTYFL
jgi:hypothetical protein